MLLARALPGGRPRAATADPGESFALTRNPFLVAFMAPTPPPLPTGLSDRLALIIAGLRGVLAAHMAKDRSAVYGSQVQYLLADPEMVALLADVPQGGPILRPLCRMLGIRLGPELGTKRRGPSCRDLAVLGRRLRLHRAYAMGTRSARGPTRRWPGLRRLERTAFARPKRSGLETLCFPAI